ncbi:MAG TPA: hypothetical protein PKC87_02030 [Candidatus Absconditabacterales bacterium]|nr:hypothetical protein [Candidatus Absconditabacterales bacterium]
MGRGHYVCKIIGHPRYYCCKREELSYALDKRYKERFLIYKIENNMGFTVRIKDLIEQHGRRKKDN